MTVRQMSKFTQWHSAITGISQHFLKADCVRSKHEKHSQDSRENCQVQNTIALIWQLLSSILNTKFWNMLEHHGFSFAWKIKSMVFLTTFPSSCH